ncbi:lipoprotein [Deinococcus arenae]|uniref:Lipoprotein n=1 Tax=Deinococcus arenae TaxID=1452751 RepID=A0A8H9LAP5_9DEIO|nr:MULTISPECIES: hypothetical protein [Deinococcus]GGM60070.1 lipoprotein [Deinococcus arenae]
MKMNILLVAGVLLAGAALAQSASTQVAPETHPVGDIPDSQAFVRYSSVAGHFSLEVPEGWSRRTQGQTVTFTSKLGAVELSVQKGAPPLTLSKVKARELTVLHKTVRNLNVTAVRDVKLPAGPAVLVRFTSTGDVNAVTGRATRQDNDLYVLARNGQGVTVRFSAPLGADNVDAWTRMAHSFRWQ